eukprot:Transcript_22036.p1 GENE.Transcript_22036~~Transcript_22036.p1  ORF type:complete len:376 (-),score=51.43 Transcript_22036:118-1245(-)
MSRKVTLFALLVLAAGADAHGALITPPARNAEDRFLPEFAGGKGPVTSCNCGDKNVGCIEGVRASGGGQPCLWFSQGCSIGCEACTGIGSHSDSSLCNSTMEPTLPKFAWTMNRGYPDNGLADSYRHNPWRAPGAAPVTDACGTAGGTSYSHSGPGDAVFYNSSVARMGERGSLVLRPAPSGTVWRAGAAVEVSWGIRYNHGGGYQYRICPADQPLTEACFQRTPLAFDRTKQALQWNNGTRWPIAGTWVDTGTLPAGSTWAMNPIPRIDFDDASSGQPKGFSHCTHLRNGSVVGAACRQFAPPCPQDAGWRSQDPVNTADVVGVCSGDWVGGRIVDTVLIPKTLAPGAYVLGWRWDCEESTQVWSSCADVTIVA